MDEVTYRKLDLWIKIISTATIVVTIILGIRQYNLSTEANYKKTFWEKRLELYLEVSRTAASLASRETDESRTSKIRFLELFHGDLVVVEDEEVLKAMKVFHDRLITYEDDPTIQEEILGLSRDLAQACRESLKQSWDIPLKDNLSIYSVSVSEVKSDGNND